MRRVQHKLSYANVVSTLCLFLVLGGGAWAAMNLPKNSVGAKQLKKHSVTPSKVAPQTITVFKGQKGNTGAPGAPGSALAFAHVSGHGVLDRARSKNVLGVTAACSPGAGCMPAGQDLCFHLAVPVHNAVVSEDISDQGNQTAFVVLPAPTSLGGVHCPAPFTDAMIDAPGTGMGGATNGAFFVAFN